MVKPLKAIPFKKPWTELLTLVSEKLGGKSMTASDCLDDIMVTAEGSLSQSVRTAWRIGFETASVAEVDLPSQRQRVWKATLSQEICCAFLQPSWLGSE